MQKSDTDQKQDVHSPQRHGFWWVIDMTYYLLVCLSWPVIVKDLRSVPEQVLNKNRIIANTPDQLWFGGQSKFPLEVDEMRIAIK